MEAEFRSPYRVQRRPCLFWKNTFTRDTFNLLVICHILGHINEEKFGKCTALHTEFHLHSYANTRSKNMNKIDT